MVKKKIILILTLILLPSILAITCGDNFESTDEIIQICGYCSELNGSKCSLSVSCNFTIYYSNFTKYIENKTAINHGDGSFSYNITQYVNGTKNLSDGNYFGELYCGERSRDDLEFTVGTRTQLGGSYGGSLLTRPEAEEEIPKSIPEDINNYIDYLAKKFIPSDIQKGRYLIYFLLIVLLFSKEMYTIIKKIKLRKNFHG